MRVVRGWDVVAGLALATFMVAVSVVARTTQPDARSVNAFGVVLLLVCGLALAIRRAAPALAFTLAECAAAAYLGLRFGGWPVYVGAFAGLVSLVSGINATRRWIPLAAAGGVAIAIATGPPEGWQAARMMTVAAVWAVVAVLAFRTAQTRRRLAAQEAAGLVGEERLRIARELHDVLSHSLASISLQAGVGLHLLDRDPQQARHALSAIRQASTSALAQARDALAVVRGTPGVSSSAPGLADLHALVASVRASGLAVTIDVDLCGAAPDEALSATTFRVVQEALTNVMRHAGPGAHARVRLSRTRDDLEITVTNDGCGDPPSPSQPGHGLAGMSERVTALGGRLLAGATADGGYQVHARLPLASPQ